MLSVDINNTGALQGALPASTADEMLVTLSDPFGRAVSARQSRYVDAATGRTAIGTTGGTVQGTGGSELRLPKEARAQRHLQGRGGGAPEHSARRRRKAVKRSRLGATLGERMGKTS